MNLTPKQLGILRRIRDSRATRGYSPTMQELADALSVSKVTVFDHVEALVRKGALVRNPNKARSLNLATGLRLPDETQAGRLPLVGTIAAGRPIEAVEDQEYLDLESLFTGPGTSSENTFVLRVRGDSMIDEQIRDGDYVICRKASRANNGQTVVALLANGDATLKRFYREKNGQVRLQPANERYEPLLVPADEVCVQGVLIGVIRSCAMPRA